MELAEEFAARDLARQVARELMKRREPQTHSWRIDVRDGEGRQCSELLFACVDESYRRPLPDKPWLGASAMCHPTEWSNIRFTAAANTPHLNAFPIARRSSGHSDSIVRLQ
jgi:hypothetical protein